MKSSLSPAVALALSLAASTCGAAHASHEPKHHAKPARAPAHAAQPSSLPVANPTPGTPAIAAHSWVLIDYASGQELAAGDPDLRVEPASLTKLMTAYVVFDALRAGRLHVTDEVLISEHAWRAEGSRTFVQVGTRVPVEVLLKGMIVQSGNDATIALAEKVGGTEEAFVQMMNSQAARLGMRGTHFADASGLPSSTHYSTARDLALLSRAIIRDFPEYYSLYSLREFTWNNIRQENRNGLLERDPSVDGIKTGHTETAGFCLISSAHRAGMRLVSVVLGTASVGAREAGSATLLEYGFANFETVTVKRPNEQVLLSRVYKGAAKSIAVTAVAPVAVTVPRGQSATVTSSATVRSPLVAPLAATDTVGELKVSAGNKALLTVPLHPGAAVPAGSWWRRLVDTIILWF